jgi:transposase InsO family protein
LGIGIAGRAHAVEGALDALLEHDDGDGVEAGDRRALTLVAEADHDHRAGLADGTEGLPDVLVLDDADADDRRVKRDFPAQKINQKWYGDGTEIKTGQGKLYLASVLDMASRRVLGFALGEHHDAALTYGALAMAVAVRGGQVPGVIMHTDRGRIHRGRLPRGLPAPGRLPVDGQSRVRAGQGLRFTLHLLVWVGLELGF